MKGDIMKKGDGLPYSEAPILAELSENEVICKEDKTINIVKYQLDDSAMMWIPALPRIISPKVEIIRPHFSMFIFSGMVLTSAILDKGPLSRLSREGGNLSCCVDQDSRLRAMSFS